MLDWFVGNAYAMGNLGGGGTGGTGGAGGGGGGMSIIIPLLLILVVFYFLLIRPQQRAEKRRKEMLGSLKKGYKVITAGGIRGTVVKFHEREKIVVVNIAPNVDVEVALVKIEAAAPPGEPLGGEAISDGKKDGTKGGSSADSVGRTSASGGPRRPKKQ